MARPRKKGLDYFPLDVDIFQDKKIRILKAKYGVDGFTIYVYLLCEIYKNGYYLKADDDFICIMADDLRMSINKVKQVLNFLLERSLFDNTLFQSDKVLTSTSVQRRYQLAVKERAKKITVEIKDFWLLKKEETETFIQVRPFLENSEEKSAKESKENKRKLNKSISKCVPHLHAHEKEQLINEFGKDIVEDYIQRTTNYKCCNYATIRQWILEDRKKKSKKQQEKNQFKRFMEREASQEELDEMERILLRN